MVLRLSLVPNLVIVSLVARIFVMARQSLSIDRNSVLYKRNTEANPFKTPVSSPPLWHAA